MDPSAPPLGKAEELWALGINKYLPHTSDGRSGLNTCIPGTCTWAIMNPFSPLSDYHILVVMSCCCILVNILKKYCGIPIIFNLIGKQKLAILCKIMKWRIKYSCLAEGRVLCSFFGVQLRL